MENEENIEVLSEEEVEIVSDPEEEVEETLETEEEIEETSVEEEEVEETSEKEEAAEVTSEEEEEVVEISVRKGESNEEIQSEDVSSTSIDYTSYLEAMQTDIRLNSLALIALIIFLGLVHGFKKL